MYLGQNCGLSKSGRIKQRKMANSEVHFAFSQCFSIGSVCHFILSKQHVAMGTMTSVRPHDYP